MFIVISFEALLRRFFVTFSLELYTSLPFNKLIILSCNSALVPCVGRLYSEQIACSSVLYQ